MGQASHRGSYAERVQRAQALQAFETPINVPCKTCGQLLNGFTLLKHMPSGAAWRITCGCGASTTAIVQSGYSTLPRTFASAVGLASDWMSEDPRVSVTFLNKTIETVESGVVFLP